MNHPAFLQGYFSMNKESARPPKKLIKSWLEAANKAVAEDPRFLGRIAKNSIPQEAGKFYSTISKADDTAWKELWKVIKQRVGSTGGKAPKKTRSIAETIEKRFGFPRNMTGELEHDIKLLRKR